MNQFDQNATKNLGFVKEYVGLTPLSFEAWTIGKEEQWRLWVEKYKWHSVLIAFLYLVLVFAGKRWMHGKPAYVLRTPMILWSGTLAIFSILGAIRSVPEFVYMLKNYGCHYSLCHPSYFHGQTSLWSLLFTLSKVWELGDTAFIILKKQKLIFLHWYHHATVMVYCFFSFAEHTSPGRWFYVMNYVVHAFMYSYYTVRAMRFRVPRWCNIFVTSIQISQMIVGSGIFTYIIYNLYSTSNSGTSFCSISQWNVIYGSLMYLSYLLLFVEFFYNTYINVEKQTDPRLREPLRPISPSKNKDRKTSQSSNHNDVNGVSNGFSNGFNSTVDSSGLSKSDDIRQRLRNNSSSLRQTK